MQTEPINAFQIEKGDNILVGDQTYLILDEPKDDGDFLLFDTRDQDDDLTQLPFGPFDIVFLVVSFDDNDINVDDWEPEDAEF